jgi:hypothetical protein
MCSNNRRERLRSLVAALAVEDLSSRSDGQIDEDFCELQRASEVLEAEKLRRLREIERRGTFRLDGHLSLTAWLADRFGMAWGRAVEQVRVSRALDEMPLTRAALSAGEVSTSSARVLCAARESHPGSFAEHEEALLEAARSLPVGQLRRAVAYWEQAVDSERSLQEGERLFERRRLHVSPTLQGMVRVDGDLDPESGETLITALQAVMDPHSRRTRPDDQRSAPQRRADALGEICRTWLDTRARPTVGGERPHVTVTVDLDTLRADAPGRAELDHVGPIHPESVRRIACDASISRVVTRGSSEPLDVGRRTPVVRAPLRRAIVARDRTCRFPGCDRPHPWCDAHHVEHWARGGTTSLENLVLLCRPHHRLIHEGRFGIRSGPNGPSFIRSDGTPLLERAGRAPPRLAG